MLVVALKQSPLRVLHLSTEEGGGQLVRLVAYDEVVATVRGAEFLSDVFIARQLVEARDGKVVLEEPVTGARRFQFVVRQDFTGVQP